MAMKTKQRMLKEDWEFFKQRRFIEEQVGFFSYTILIYTNASCIFVRCKHRSVVYCTSSVQSNATMPDVKFGQLKYRKVRSKKSM